MIFGAKCNNIQADGLSIIEILLFNTSSKGTRLPHSITMHIIVRCSLFGEDVKKIGGDFSYAGTANGISARSMAPAIRR